MGQVTRHCFYLSGNEKKMYGEYANINAMLEIEENC